MSICRKGNLRVEMSREERSNCMSPHSRKAQDGKKIQQMIESFKPIQKATPKTKQIENHFPAGVSDSNIHCMNNIQSGLLSAIKLALVC